MGDVSIEHAVGLPGPALGTFVRRYDGYRYSGLPPGTHLGLAAPDLTVDHAHLARDWRDFAGCPPSRWLANEELPLVQDGNGRFSRSLTA